MIHPCLHFLSRSLLCRTLLVLLALGPRIAASSGSASSAVEITQWRSGLTEINEGWATHEGDDLRWAQPAFNDSGWGQVDIEDLGAAKPGWRWFRKHVRLGSHHDMGLLLDGGIGTYELYLNGERMPGTGIRPSFAVNRPVERVFELSRDDGDFEIAVRTHATPGYIAYRFPLFLGVTVGEPTVIEYERQALESQRLYSAAPTAAVNLLLVIAALGALVLFASQRTQRDYLFLAVFLFSTGVSNALWHLQQAGIGPLSENFLIADPLVYLISIAQIEFTFSFARRRVGIGWRVYEFLLLAPVLLVPAVWLGRFSQDTYNIVEAGATAPLAFLLPAFLAYWYRRGNREAGLLILPSLVPTAMGVLYNLGLVGTHFGRESLDVLTDPIQIGVFPVQISDAGSLVFLLAIGVVILLRFTRVSREQARSAAELNAAREIQQRLVPAILPSVDGYAIETAYLPAQEVGGDFYQVLSQCDGGTLVVIGDVSGKGLKAAMTGALAIGALRTLSSECLAPAALLSRLNQALLQSQEAGFVTCLCVRIHPSGEILLSNAGHLAPYQNGVEVAVESGLPLGIADGVQYGELSLRFELGDRLMLLSDGVLEARNSHGELFGFDRTQAISTGSAAQMADIAQAFGQEDDITVLSLRYTAADVHQP